GNVKYLLGMPQKKALSEITLAALLGAGATGLYVSNHTLADPNPEVVIAQEAHPQPASSPMAPEQKEKSPITATSQKPVTVSQKPTETKPKTQVVILEDETHTAVKWVDKLGD